MIFFYIFSALTVVTAFLVITLRNPLSSAFALVLSLFGVACLFALLGAHFLAAMQVLVYAGAIMVLFVFVIMLMDLKKEQLSRIKIGFASVVGILVGGYFGILMVMQLGFVSYPLPLLPERGYGTIREVGRVLFSDYLIPFEVTSLLLLIAILGVVILGKRERVS